MGACVETRNAEAQQDVDTREPCLQSLLQCWWRDLASKIVQKPVVFKVQQPFRYSKPIERARKMKQELLNMSSGDDRGTINKSDLNQLEKHFDRNVDLASCCRMETQLSTYLKAVNKAMMETMVEPKVTVKRHEEPKKKCQPERWWVNSKKDEPPTTVDVTSNMVLYLQTELQLMERYLALHVKDSSFVKENVHVTLHISVKDILVPDNIAMNKSRRQQIKILCKQAILCLIEPSENAFVRYENDLPEVIKNYQEIGCQRHFDLPSEENNFYWSVLVLSAWAKLLLRQPNAILMQTIGCALGCNTCRILVLSYPEVSPSEQ